MGIPGYRDTPTPAWDPDTPVDLAEAEEFLALFLTERPDAGSLAHRMAEVRAEVLATGTYTHTPEELTLAPRWRGATPAGAWAACTGAACRCWTAGTAGRPSRSSRTWWPTFGDQRHRSQPGPDPADGLGLPGGGAGPPVRPGLERPVDPVRGLPGRARRPAAGRLHGSGAALGWTSKGEAFDVLPLAVQTPGEGCACSICRRTRAGGAADAPGATLRRAGAALVRGTGDRQHAPVHRRRSVPAGAVQRVVHGHRDRRPQPRRLRTGTTCCPWSPRRSAGHLQRATLWRDRALVELNRAVLWSLSSARRADQRPPHRDPLFLTHVEREEQAGRKTPADWSWIVPPMSGAATPVFHRYYHEADLRPNFYLDPVAQQLARCGRSEVPNGRATPLALDRTVLLRPPTPPR